MVLYKRIAEIFQHYRFVLWVYAALLLLGTALVVLYGQASIHLFINDRMTGFFDLFFKYATFLGDGLFAVMVIVVLLFIRYRYSLIQAVAFLLSGIVVQLLKRFVFKGMYRPARFFEGIADLQFVEGVKVARYNAFPSGHTATAFALFFCLIFTTRNKNLQALYLLLAFLVGFSRMYLSQHFLPDVLAGSLLGLLSALFAIYLFKYNRAHWLDRSLTDQFFKKS